VGGFSQTEIVEYLRAKQDAAKEVSKILAVDEDEKVSVSTHKVQAQKTMVATMETGSQDADSGEDEEGSLSNIAQSGTSSPQPYVSNDIISMVDVQLPKLRDIAQYETRTLKKDASRKTDIEKVQSVLRKIANPAGITDVAERQKFEKVHERLLAEKQKGNPTAVAFLAASQKAQGGASADTKTILSQIANPSLATVETDKQRFTQLHDTLTKASREGNELATAILSTKDATPVEEVEQLSKKLQDAKAKGEPVAQSVMSNLEDSEVMPQENNVQPVSPEEYDEVRRLWEENYRTLPVPAEFGSDANGRIAWIASDIASVEETIKLLNATDAESQKQGMQKVSEVLSMLLLGGFSRQEIVGYLKAKSEAGKTVTAELQKEEDSS
ncbi:MAG: hypothetical protein ACRD4B_08005, partial [Acidobacteriota bacterium]